MSPTMDSAYVWRSRVAATPGAYFFQQCVVYTEELLSCPLLNVSVEHGRDVSRLLKSRTP